MTAELWQPLWRDALNVIRESNPTRTVIVGGVQWNSIEQLQTLVLPASDPNLVATFHYYSPFQFTHQGASWVEGSEPWLGTQWAGSEVNKQAVRSDFDTAQTWAEQNGISLLMGEFGAYSTADQASRLRWTEFVRSEAERRGFMWAYWEFGAGFGAYNRETGEWNALLDALIP